MVKLIISFIFTLKKLILINIYFEGIYAKKTSVSYMSSKSKNARMKRAKVRKLDVCK